MISNNTTVKVPPTSGTYDYNAFQPGAAGFPTTIGTAGANSSYTDPIFGAVDPTGSVVTRLTDETNTVTGGQDIYGHHWANCDGTYFFHWDTAGQKQVRKTSDGSLVRNNISYTNAGNMSWHPTDPDKYFYFNGASLREYTVSSGTSTLIHTFPASAFDLGGTIDFVDRTGRYFLVRYNSGGDAGRVYDRVEDAVYTGTTAVYAGGGYMGMSPDGNYAIVSGGGTFTAYPLDHGTNTVGTGFTFWLDDGDHAGFVSASDGKTYMLKQDGLVDSDDINVIEIRDRSGRTAAQMRSDPNNTGVTTVLTSVDMVDLYLHISGVGLGTNKDWVVLDFEMDADTYDSSTAGWRKYQGEIVAVNVLTFEQRRLCHHRSRSTAIYDNEPRVSTSWDGSLILFASNFNDNDAVGYIDFWGIQNPFGAGEGGGGGGGGVALHEAGWFQTQPQTNPLRISKW